VHSPPPRGRPTPEDLEAARTRTVPDIVAPGLRVLFCGINPGLYSGATGHHFARPGNRFWRTLHLAGFTPRVLDPSEGRELLRSGLGITNLVARTTATADELTTDELRAGAEVLRAKAIETCPRVVACLGVSAYRAGFGRADAVIGPQAEALGPSRLWVLPNPSGLNAHYQLPALAALFAALRAAVDEATDGAPYPRG
jgi:TDG/mug DNA glycosylase family protein